MESVKWSSSDENVAKVDEETGEITGINGGKARITVETLDGGKTDTCDITVKVHPDTVEIAPSKTSIYKGESISLSATVSPEDASDKMIDWSSSDENLAVVDNGIVTGINSGTVEITATTCNGKKDVRHLTVKVKPELIVLYPKTITIFNGETTQLNYNVYPSEATVENAIWESSNIEILNVTSGGAVTGVSPGTAYVTVKTEDSSCTDISVITVQAVPVTGVKLEQNVKTIRQGETVNLTAEIIPKNATQRAVKWTSSNSQIVRVNEQGSISGVNSGVVVIEVKTADGGYIDTCKVTVESVPTGEPIPVTGISLKPNNTTIAAGSSKALLAEITPANAANKALTWLSSNPEIVSVDNGIITGNKVGFAAVAAITADGNFIAFSNINVVTAANIEVTGISLEPKEITLTSGQTAVLTASITPENATNKNVKWFSTDPNIAIVNELGEITAVSTGTTAIMAEADKGFRSFCQVSVSDSVINLALNKTVTASSATSQKVAAGNLTDGDFTSRWLSSTEDLTPVFEIDLEENTAFNQIKMKEFAARITKFEIDVWDGNSWITFYSGTTVGEDFTADFDLVSGSKVRFRVITNKTKLGVSLYEFELYRLLI